MAQRVGRGIALLYHDRALEGGEWSAARPGRTLPLGKDPVPILQEAGPQGRSGRAENLVPTGIRSRTVQPVAQSLYRLCYPEPYVPYTPHISSFIIIIIITTTSTFVLFERVKKMKFLNLNLPSLISLRLCWEMLD